MSLMSFQCIISCQNWSMEGIKSKQSDISASSRDFSFLPSVFTETPCQASSLLEDFS